MAEGKALNNLKDKPKEEKTAIAGGIAITVVVILLVGWGFWFVRKIQRGEEFRTVISAGQEEFYPSTVRDAQFQLEEEWRRNQDELRAIREAAAAQQAPLNPQTPTNNMGEQFNNPELEF